MTAYVASIAIKSLTAWRCSLPRAWSVALYEFTKFEAAARNQ